MDRDTPLAALITGVALLCSTISPASAGSIRPEGVFFHSYTGPFSAVEWIHIRESDGADRYRFSDIRGIAPYDGRILGNGQITWDATASQSGFGQFTTQDDATMTLMYQGGQYQSTLRRAPGTDADFITRIDSREAGNSAITGRWDLTVTELDAATGTVIGSSETGATALVTDDLLRLTYDDGTYYQGVFEEAGRAGFRVVLPGTFVDEFNSFAGSETSLSMNLMGDFRLEGEDAFSAVFLTQNRRPPGQQSQFVHVVTATRAVPAPGVGVCLLGGVLAVRRRR